MTTKAKAETMDKFPLKAVPFNSHAKTSFLMRKVKEASEFEDEVFKHNKRGRVWDERARDTASIFRRVLRSQVVECLLVTEIGVSFPEGLPQGFEEVRIKALEGNEILFEQSLREHLSTPAKLQYGRGFTGFKALACSPETALLKVGSIEVDPSVIEAEPGLGIFCPNGTVLELVLTGLPVEVDLNVRRGMTAALYTAKWGLELV